MSRVVVPMLALSLALFTAGASRPAYANKPLLRTHPASQAGIAPHTKLVTQRTKPASSKSAVSKKGPQPVAPTQSSPNQLRAERLGLGSVKAAGQLLAGRAEPHWIRAAGAPTNTLPGTLRFPVDKGHIVRAFGSGMAGYHQAIDIGGELGLSVRAAGAGIVGYAGDAINGYGNLIILLHPGGFITTYAHNQKNLVVAGQKVARNSVIAKLGSTGRSKGPHVHFELLFAGKNCDPMPIFRPAPKRKSGQSAVSAQSVWKDANKRPKTIKCAPRKHHPDYVNRPEVGEDGDDDESLPDAP
jgi:murein DD-endopeptidase MepM/ murein hydrolase activator NlpD